MDHTGYFGYEEHDIASLYLREEGAFVAAPKLKQDIAKGGSSIYSNTEDL